MSDLYTVTIDAVEGPSFKGTVHIVHPDSAYLPDQPTFPMALLMDAWYLLTQGYLLNDPPTLSGGDRYPFSVARGQEIVAGMRRGPEFAELFDCLIGDRPCSPEELARRAAGIVVSYRMGPILGIPSWQDIAAWEAAEGIPADQRTPVPATDTPVELADERTWSVLSERERDECPHAAIEVTVTDPDYLTHLTAGMRWSTAHDGNV